MVVLTKKKCVSKYKNNSKAKSRKNVSRGKSNSKSKSNFRSRKYFNKSRKTRKNMRGGTRHGTRHGQEAAMRKNYLTMPHNLMRGMPHGTWNSKTYEVPGLVPGYVDSPVTKSPVYDLATNAPESHYMNLPVKPDRPDRYKGLTPTQITQQITQQKEQARQEILNRLGPSPTLPTSPPKRFLAYNSSTGLVGESNTQNTDLGFFGR